MVFGAGLVSSFRWARKLDDYATDEPGFREGHPEDRCPLCGWPVTDHRPTYSRKRGPARWPHRRAALMALIMERLS